ncbi:MAG: prepilin-type N-terminal cleavage/methylation domain-containing protein [Planctomycetes bacterium]|nr:prepilin-type N-terminal cleavage/methylation domain-containing protein [Planctomycetota bacterium]
MRRQAFTIIELLVVVAIIAVLIAILLPSLQKARDVSKSVVCSTHLNQLNLATVLYSVDYQSQLPSPREWVDNSIAWFDSWKTPASVRQGTLYKYVGQKDKLYLCPKFTEVCPAGVTPAFSYAMNIYTILPGQVSPQGWAGCPSIRRIADVRTPARLFLFTEESPWIASVSMVAIDDALFAPTFDPKISTLPFVEALGTYHNGSDLYNGTGNAVFFDGHVSAHPVEDTYEIGTPINFR